MVEEISQAERRRILAEDRMSTYHALAQSSIDDERGGRYAAASRPATFVGAGPVSYPKLPEDSPSNQLAKMPDEPSLGYSVDDQDPIGEAFEQEASKRRRPWRRL